MSGYVIYGIKYTKGIQHLINTVKILAVALLFKNALKRKELFEKEYSAQEDTFSIWEIYISDEVDIY